MVQEEELKVIIDLLRDTRCIDLLKGQQMIEIDASATIAEGCQSLISHGISSAPVYNKELNEYAGMLDYRDIVDYVLTVFHKKRCHPVSEDEAIGISEIVNKATAGESVPAEAIVDLSRKNPFYSVMTHSTLEAVVEIFTSNLGIHRINVMDNGGRVAGILSKTDVVRFLLSKSSLFKNAVSKKLNNIHLDHCPLVSIHSDSTVLDALERMSEYSVSSIPVISQDGKLIGNISMADVRFVLQHNRFNRLWLNCANFVSIALSQKGLEAAGQDPYPVFEVRPDYTVERVMQKLLATHTHRIWVVNEQSHLEGVVSMTDIIRYLCKSTK